MKRLKNYLDKVLNKSFMNSDGRIYHIRSINHEVMSVVYDNGDEDFLASFLHYNDKRVYRFKLKQPVLKRSKGIRGEDPNRFVPCAQSQPKYAEKPRDYIDDHCCCSD